MRILSTPNPAARAVRVVGVLVVLALLLLSLLSPGQGSTPVLIVILAVYVFGFVAVTSHLAPVPAVAIAIGSLTGVAATALVTALFIAHPPAPSSDGWALALVALTAVVAGAVTARRHNPPSAVVVAALLAAVIVALLVPMIVSVLATVGPESWVPRMTSHALTPAARLAERRDLAGDDYLRTFLDGDVLALTLGVVSLWLRRWSRRPAEPAGPARTIELTR